MTPEALASLKEVARFLRAFQILMYGGVLKEYNALVTDEGLAQMAAKGLLTDAEVRALQESDLPVRQRHNAVLEWAAIHVEEQCAAGVYERVHPGLFTTKMCDLRGTYATIGDELDARLPLAYAHFVQILVDAFLVMTPFCLFEEMGGWCIFASGLLTVSEGGREGVTPRGVHLDCCCCCCCLGVYRACLL